MAKTKRARSAASMSARALRVPRSGTEHAISASTASFPKRSTPRKSEVTTDMTGSLAVIMVGMLAFFAIGGVAFAFVGGASSKAKKRMASVARPTANARALKGAADTNQQRRKNVQAMLKELEAQTAAKKKRVSLRRRIEQAGLEITPRTFWMMSVIAGALAAVIALLTTKAWYAAPLAGF